MGKGDRRALKAIRAAIVWQNRAALQTEEGPSRANAASACAAGPWRAIRRKRWKGRAQPPCGRCEYLPRVKASIIP